MDSKALFAQVYAAQMCAEWNAQMHRPIHRHQINVSTVIDRIQTYQRIIATFGTMTAMEKYLKLVVTAKGDVRIKRELMDEFLSARA